MTIKASEIANNYPILTYRYRITVGEEVMAFSKVSGLKTSREEIDYKDGMGGRVSMSGEKSDLDFTLSRGVVSKESQLWAWLNQASTNRLEKKDISISLINETGTELLITWNILNAFPTGLSAPDFDSTSNDVALEELSLSADSMTIEYH
ncbi:phage tail-like protein [Sinobacterium caligoides]|uniref:Phage tail-like protein n=1 Tax=Sinobacterium caligoides TaxID=933926 RepID=A0A3N2DN25_9GAMM|nr:phage tail protein [Sinobacterium caligoides]ROS01082.1 phage tail-like protein [Sinobacterium caligoides]